MKSQGALSSLINSEPWQCFNESHIQSLSMVVISMHENISLSIYIYLSLPFSLSLILSLSFLLSFFSVSQISVALSFSLSLFFFFFHSLVFRLTVMKHTILLCTERVKLLYQKAIMTIDMEKRQLIIQVLISSEISHAYRVINSMILIIYIHVYISFNPFSPFFLNFIDGYIPNGIKPICIF